MKDYSLNYEDSKTFILNYKIEDNKIIVNLACKKECIIPYSLVNEKELENKYNLKIKDLLD